MRFRTRVIIFIDAFKRRVRKGKKSGLYRTAGLIRKEARESMRFRKRASTPGTPPSAHTRGGLKQIDFYVENDTRAYIGPILFRRRTRINKPVTNVQEVGGTVVESRPSRSIIKRYPARSFMWTAVKKLKSKGKLVSKFRYMLRG